MYKASTPKQLLNGDTVWRATEIIIVEQVSRYSITDVIAQGKYNENNSKKFGWLGFELWASITERHFRLSPISFAVAENAARSYRCGECRFTDALFQIFTDCG